MNNDRELMHAALQWHAIHARRVAIGAEKRRLDKEIKVEGFDVMFSPARAALPCCARQLTEIKRKEMAALRLLAKACAKQRSRLNLADVIDLDIEAKLLTCAD